MPPPSSSPSAVPSSRFIPSVIYRPTLPTRINSNNSTISDLDINSNSTITPATTTDSTTSSSTISLTPPNTAGFPPLPTPTSRPQPPLPHHLQVEDSIRLGTVKSIINLHLSRPDQSVSLARLRRTFAEVITDHTSNLIDLYSDSELLPPLSLLKGSGDDISSLVSPSFPEPGDRPLDRPLLNPDRMASLHLSSCRLCRPPDLWHDQCYGRNLLRVIVCGIKLPFTSPPPRVLLGPYPAARPFAKHIMRAIDKMQKEFAMRPIDEKDVHVSAPYTTVIKPPDRARVKELLDRDITNSDDLDDINEYMLKVGLKEIKIRLVIDLSKGQLNACLLRLPFRLIGICDIIFRMRRGMFIATIDLSDAFFRLGLADEHTKYICLKGPDNNYYSYTHLPFGLSPAPWYQTVISAKLCMFARALGIDIVVYLDDFALFHMNEATLRSQVETTVTMFDSVNAKVNRPKINWPSQVVPLLGFTLDTQRMAISIETARCRHYSADIDSLLARLPDSTSTPPTITADARKLAGRLQWLSGITMAGRTHLMSVWDFVSGRHDRSHHDDVVADLTWWKSKLAAWQRQASGDQVVFDSGLLTTETLSRAIIVSSDASDTGLGYWWSTLHDSVIHMSAVPIPTQHRSSSSTFREALAVQDFIHTHRQLIHNTPVIFMTDNVCLAYVLNSGVTHSAQFTPLIRIIMEELDNALSPMVALFVPRDLNQCADLLSRLCDSSPSHSAIRDVTVSTQDRR